MKSIGSVTVVFGEGDLQLFIAGTGTMRSFSGYRMGGLVTDAEDRYDPTDYDAWCSVSFARATQKHC